MTPAAARQLFSGRKGARLFSQEDKRLEDDLWDGGGMWESSSRETRFILCGPRSRTPGWTCAQATVTPHPPCGRGLSIRGVPRRKELQLETGNPPRGEVGEAFWKPIGWLGKKCTEIPFSLKNLRKHNLSLRACWRGKWISSLFLKMGFVRSSLMH